MNINFNALVALSLASIVVPISAYTMATPVDERLRFDEASIHIETNVTDSDGEGFIVVKSPEGMKELSVTFPDGKKSTMSLTSKDAIGQGQVVLESAEPTLDDVFAAYPEGMYKFEAKTLDGRKIKGEATLTHSMLAEPVISPSDGADVAADDAEIAWLPVVGATSYLIEVENKLLGLKLNFRVPADVLMFTVPVGLLIPGNEYSLAVAAESATGNVTLVEQSFLTH